ncbi:MAG: hypothetical protein K0S07_343 [Chlamydiales bacterium]|jgi:hypothetical protein|nr:hypothetical protein [Chlamydiales bacterium]
MFIDCHVPNLGMGEEKLRPVEASREALPKEPLLPGALPFFTGEMLLPCRNYRVSYEPHISERQESQQRCFQKSLSRPVEKDCPAAGSIGPFQELFLAADSLPSLLSAFEEGQRKMAGQRGLLKAPKGAVSLSFLFIEHLLRLLKMRASLNERDIDPFIKRLKRLQPDWGSSQVSFFWEGGIRQAKYPMTRLLSADFLQAWKAQFNAFHLVCQMIARLNFLPREQKLEPISEPGIFSIPDIANYSLLHALSFISCCLLRKPKEGRALLQALRVQAARLRQPWEAMVLSILVQAIDYERFCISRLAVRNMCAAVFARLDQLSCRLDFERQLEGGTLSLREIACQLSHRLGSIGPSPQLGEERAD